MLLLHEFSKLLVIPFCLFIFPCLLIYVIWQEVLGILSIPATVVILVGMMLHESFIHDIAYRQVYLNLMLSFEQFKYFLIVYTCFTPLRYVSATGKSKVFECL